MRAFTVWYSPPRISRASRPVNENLSMQPTWFGALRFSDEQIRHRVRVILYTLLTLILRSFAYFFLSHLASNVRRQNLVSNERLTIEIWIVAYTWYTWYVDIWLLVKLARRIDFMNRVCVLHKIFICVFILNKFYCIIWETLNMHLNSSHFC